jgi:hypothetical protein
MPVADASLRSLAVYLEGMPGGLRFNFTARLDNIQASLTQSLYRSHEGGGPFTARPPGLGENPFEGFGDSEQKIDDDTAKEFKSKRTEFENKLNEFDIAATAEMIYVSGGLLTHF